MKTIVVLAACVIFVFSSAAFVQADTSDENYYLRTIETGVKYLQSDDKDESDRATNDLMSVTHHIINADTNKLEPLVLKFTRILKDERAHVRRNCLLVMREIRNYKIVDMVISSLKDENMIVRYTAAESLPLSRDPDAEKPPLRGVEQLIQLSKLDKSAYVRAQAGVALGSYHLHYPKNVQILKALQEAAHDPDAHVRQEVNTMLELAKKRNKTN